MPDFAHYSGSRVFKQRYWFLSFIALPLILCLSGCANFGVSASSTPDPGGGGGGKKGGRKGGGGDVPVTVAVAMKKDVPVEVQVIGNVEAYSTISVKALVGGELTNVLFHEGDFVRKNQLLFEIDRRPLEAALSQTQATLLQNTAMLGQAKANLERDTAQAHYAEAQANRYSELFKNGIISRDQSEQLRANADATQQAVEADNAAIESAKATIEAGKAAVENSKVQLSYTRITSTIDGRTGNLTVKQGNVVQATSMELVTINQVEPIYVTFSVPEAQLPAIKSHMAGHSLQVRARPQDETTAGEETGTLTFIDNSVDVTTGTIKLKGTFQNTDHQLWPGQFVRVTLKLATQVDAVVVPNEAVQTGQNGSFVYVVKPDRSVENRPIVTGARVNQDMVIDRGLDPGETVVTEGQLRLAPGSKVIVRAPGGGPGGKGSGKGGGRKATS
jgi:multidrug efflux system membrane fusion protein